MTCVYALLLQKLGFAVVAVCLSLLWKEIHGRDKHGGHKGVMTRGSEWGVVQGGVNILRSPERPERS